MTKPIVRIHDIETDKIIEREMTDAEIKEYEKRLAALEAEKQAEIAKIAEKAALYERLGITADEAKLLLS